MLRILGRSFPLSTILYQVNFKRYPFLFVNFPFLFAIIRIMLVTIILAVILLLILLALALDGTGAALSGIIWLNHTILFRRRCGCLPLYLCPQGWPVADVGKIACFLVEFPPVSGGFDDRRLDMDIDTIFGRILLLLLLLYLLLL